MKQAPIAAGTLEASVGREAPIARLVRNKIKWMLEWVDRNGMQLELEGECGLGRPCVGVVVDKCYPNYEWYDENYERIDSNGDVWKPPDAYHKHPCVAVLGRGEYAESQLYDWLKWFDNNGFKLETGFIPGQIDPILTMLGKHKYARMVRNIKHEQI